MSRTNEDRANIASNMSVAERREKAASLGVSMSDFKSGQWRPSQGASPKPSPSPSPSSGGGGNVGPTKPSGGGGGGGSSSSGGGGGGGSYGGGGGRGMTAKQATGMSVKEQRAAAAKANMQLSDWKAKMIAKATKKQNGGSSGGGGMFGGSSSSSSTSSSSNQSTGGNQWTQKYGEGLQGYANWYNAEGMQAAKDREAEYKKNNPNAGLSKRNWNTLTVNENGLFNYDSTEAINGLDVAMMKQFGIKGGDKIFDPSTYKSINASQGATTDGTLNAHYFEEGLAMPLRTDSMGGQMADHEAQMRRNQFKEQASSTQLLSSEGLYQDKYAVGYHGEDDMGENFVGSDHSESINQYISDHNKHRGINDIRSGIDSYIRDGGYAGDALKILDGKHKENLTSPEDIKWYNSLVQEAKAFDWEAENQSRAGDAGGYYDVRAGGLSNSSRIANEEWAERQKQYNSGGQSSNYWDTNSGNSYQGSSLDNTLTSASGAGTPKKDPNKSWLDFSFQGIADDMYAKQQNNQNAQSSFYL